MNLWTLIIKSIMHPIYVNETYSFKCRMLNFFLRMFVKQKLSDLIAENNPDQQIQKIIQFRHRIDQLSIEDKSVPQKDSSIHQIKVRWFFAPNPTAATLLYFHGGAYIFGSVKFYSGICAAIAKKCNLNVLYFDYALSPENGPALRIKQSILVYKWLLKNKSDKPIFFAGDSAGGGLALATTIFLRDHQDILPQAIICFSPFTDLSFSGESIIRNAHKDSFIKIPKQIRLLQEMDVKNKYISPIFDNFANLPPLFIQVGENEVLYDDARRVSQKAYQQQTSVILEVWKNVPHAWPIFVAFLPEAKSAINHATDFIKQMYS